LPNKNKLDEKENPAIPVDGRIFGFVVLLEGQQED